MELESIIMPYDKKSLEPVISEQTMEFHFEKHYKGYITNCNKLKEGTPFENKTLDEIIIESDGVLFNNAAQIKNHEMFFLSLSPIAVKGVTGEFLNMINEQFGSLELLKDELTNKSTTLFGSGWVWLVVNLEGKLQIIQGGNAYCPIIANMYPLLCIDVWEHAYYLDYQNRRADFVKELWKIFDWSVVQGRFEEKCAKCK